MDNELWAKLEDPVRYFEEAKIVLDHYENGYAKTLKDEEFTKKELYDYRNKEGHNPHTVVSFENKLIHLREKAVGELLNILKIKSMIIQTEKASLIAKKVWDIREGVFELNINAYNFIHHGIEWPNPVDELKKEYETE